MVAGCKIPVLALQRPGISMNHKAKYCFSCLIFQEIEVEIAG
jgi:hypothetical protein